MTATLLGSKNGRSDATTASWSRSATRVSYRSVAAIGNCDLDLAALELAADLEAHRLEDAEHVAVVGHHLGHEPLDPHGRGARGELLEQAGADAAPLVLVGDGERRLRDRAVAEPHVVAHGDDRSPPSRPRPCPGARRARSSRARAPARRAAARPEGSRGSGGRGSARESPRKNSSSASASRGRGGRSRRLRPSRRMTSTASVSVIAAALSRAPDGSRAASRTPEAILPVGLDRGTSYACRPAFFGAARAWPFVCEMKSRYQ